MDVFSQHTHKSLLSHWTPQQTDVGHTMVIVQRGTQNIYILKVTNKNKFPTLHTRHTSMTDTLFQLCELHLCGYYPVLYSFFSLGQLRTNHRVQSHSPISRPNTESNHVDQSLPFQMLLRCARRQVTSPLAEAWTSSTSLSVGHHPTRSCRRG